MNDKNFHQLNAWAATILVIIFIILGIFSWIKNDMSILSVCVIGFWGALGVSIGNFMALRDIK